ncbi:MAG: CDP-alcohol phosphatidyltransferase family protein, partial [Tabrizicola sp.]|nr:CDP-alcohol phosphatidyltransferase family protein [Tabrizicola sp.]
MNNASSDTRIHKSILATGERRFLEYMAVHIPGFVKPDHLTALGVVGGFIVLFGYVLSLVEVSYLWLANIGLVIHWVGDSLDGTLARVRGVVRPRYGFFLDQCIDLLGNLLIAVGLGITTFVRLDISLLVLSAYHMLSIYTFVRNIVTGEMHISVMGCGPTELRIGIVVLNILLMTFGAPPLALFDYQASWCDAFLMVV